MDFGHFIFMGYEIWTFHTSVSVQYMTSYCLACFFMFIHVVACVNTLSLFMAEYHNVVCIYQIFFIQSPIDGHLDCFYLLAIVDNDAVNIHVQVFFLSTCFQFFRV